MTDFDALMAGVEKSAPDDPLSLLVCADWCDEHGEDDLAFALRWAAKRQKRPYENDRYPPGRRWSWRNAAHYRNCGDLDDDPEHLPDAVMCADGPDNERSVVWRGTTLKMYRWLGWQLKKLRDVLNLGE